MITQENAERTHDDNERYAMAAIMNAAASRGKGKQGKLPSLEDLYKRPTSEDESRKKTETLLERNQEASEWLSQFNIKGFGGKEQEEDG